MNTGTIECAPVPPSTAASGAYGFNECEGLPPVLALAVRSFKLRCALLRATGMPAPCEQVPSLALQEELRLAGINEPIKSYGSKDAVHNAEHQVSIELSRNFKPSENPNE